MIELQEELKSKIWAEYAESKTKPAFHLHKLAYLRGLYKGALLALESTGWIDCKDRLPDGWTNGGDTVLVRLNNGDLKIGFIHGDDWDYEVRGKVTHWAPIPEFNTSKP